MLPLPDTTTIANSDKIESFQALGQEPTASHALALADHDEKGAAQQDHDAEVQDLGWNEPKEKVAQPLVGGMDNEELWLLVRRFNKVGPNTITASRRLTARLANVPCQRISIPATEQPRPQHSR